MANYPPAHWMSAPPPRVSRVRRPGTALARWSVFLGIQSVLLGAFTPIPLAAIVLGIIALARGTALPGRATAGLILGASFLLPWAGFVALCIYTYVTSHTS